MRIGSADEKAILKAVEEVEIGGESDVDGVSAYVSSPLFLALQPANTPSALKVRRRVKLITRRRGRG